MITAQQVYEAEFRRATAQTVGYDEVVVDDFLDRIIATLSPLDRGHTPPRGAVTSQQVVETEFPERVGGGYDMDDVDDLLDLVAQRLFAVETAAKTQENERTASSSNKRADPPAPSTQPVVAAGAPTTPATDRQGAAFVPATDSATGTFGEPGVRADADTEAPASANQPERLIAKSERLMDEAEQPSAERAVVVVEAEPAVVEPEQRIAEDEHTVVEAEQPIDEPEQAVVESHAGQRDDVSAREAKDSEVNDGKAADAVNAVGAEPLDESAQVPAGQVAQRESSEEIHPVGSEPDEPRAAAQERVERSPQSEQQSADSAATHGDASGDLRREEAPATGNRDDVPATGLRGRRTGSTKYVAPAAAATVSTAGVADGGRQSVAPAASRGRTGSTRYVAPVAVKELPDGRVDTRTDEPRDGWPQAEPLRDDMRRSDATGVAPGRTNRAASTMGGSWDTGIGAERPLQAPDEVAAPVASAAREDAPASSAGSALPHSDVPQSTWAPSEQPEVKPVERPVDGEVAAPVVSYPATDRRVPLPRAESPRAHNDADSEAESQYHPEFSNFSTPEGAEAKKSFDPFAAPKGRVEEDDRAGRQDVRYVPSEPSAGEFDSRGFDPTQVGVRRGVSEDRGENTDLSERAVGSRDPEFTPFAAGQTAEAVDVAHGEVEPTPAVDERPATSGVRKQRVGSPMPTGAATSRDGGRPRRVPAMNEETNTGREPRDPAGVGNPPAEVSAELAARHEEREAAQGRLDDESSPADRDEAPWIQWGVGRPEPIDEPRSVRDTRRPESIDAPKPLPARDDTSRKGLLRRIFKG